MVRGIIENTNLTAERLRSILCLNRETGEFTRISRPFSKVGSVTSKGYLCIMVDGRLYVAHRLVWLYTTGMWPPYQLDHINGCKIDNRFSNLREATNQQNCFGRGIRIDNKTHQKGVFRKKKNPPRWGSAITIGGKKINLGSFRCPTAAHFAYCRAARKIFGEYANFG